MSIKNKEQTIEKKLMWGNGFCGIAIGIAIGGNKGDYSFIINGILIAIFGLIGILILLKIRKLKWTLKLKNKYWKKG